MTPNELSRVVSHALRHAPAAYGLTTSQDGSVELTDLARGLTAGSELGHVSVDDIREMVASQTKRRHVIEGTRIRALYGHSGVDAESSAPDEPPAVLYHATSPDVVPTIMQDGLKPMRRRYVHLASNEPAAIAVGRRKARKPTLLTVDAAAAAAAGVPFHHSGDSVWTSGPIPPRFISNDGPKTQGGRT